MLSEDELRVLWAQFDALDPTMGAFYKLRLLTAQRGGEVVSMRWQDVDVDAGWWTIPPPTAKNKLAHRVPLNASVLAILKTLRAETDRILAADRGVRPDGYDSEKRSALDWWDAKLNNILRNAQREPATVVSIDARA